MISDTLHDAVQSICHYLGELPFGYHKLSKELRAEIDDVADRMDKLRQKLDAGVDAECEGLGTRPCADTTRLRTVSNKTSWILSTGSPIQNAPNPRGRTMDAKEWIIEAERAGQIIRVTLIRGGAFTGRGWALKLGHENFAVLVEDCGDPKRDGAGVGAIIKYRESNEHPGDRYIIVGQPATIEGQSRHWN